MRGKARTRRRLRRAHLEGGMPRTAQCSWRTGPGRRPAVNRNQPVMAGMPGFGPTRGRKSPMVPWPAPCHPTTAAGDSEGGSDKNTS